MQGFSMQMLAREPQFGSRPLRQPRRTLSGAGRVELIVADAQVGEVQVAANRAIGTREMQGGFVSRVGFGRDARNNRRDACPTRRFRERKS